MRPFMFALALAIVLAFPTNAQAHTVSKVSCMKQAHGAVKRLKPWNRDRAHWVARVRKCRVRGRQHRWVHRVPYVMRRIRGCESSGNYRAQNSDSTASGGYQYLDSTWSRHAGYRRAMYAPRWVQDRKATLDYRRGGTGPWKSSRYCWG